MSIRVQTEECKFRMRNFWTPEVYFRVDEGVLTDTSVAVAPVASTDRLYLVNASGLPEFRAVYDAFSRMGFYNLNPDKIRELQDPDPGDVLMRDGGNLTSVLTQLSPTVKTNIEEYLESVVPGVHAVDVKAWGPRNISVQAECAGDKTHGGFWQTICLMAHSAYWEFW